jgi:hypothetical protein
MTSLDVTEVEGVEEAVAEDMPIINREETGREVVVAEVVAEEVTMEGMAGAEVVAATEEMEVAIAKTLIHGTKGTWALYKMILIIFVRYVRGFWVCSSMAIATLAEVSRREHSAKV